MSTGKNFPNRMYCTQDVLYTGCTVQRMYCTQDVLYTGCTVHRWYSTTEDVLYTGSSYQCQRTQALFFTFFKNITYLLHHLLNINFSLINQSLDRYFLTTVEDY